MLDTASRLERFKKAEQLRQPWESVYGEAMRFGSPVRRGFNADKTESGAQKVSEKSRILFDSTGANAQMKFVSNVQSGLTPPMKRWVKLGAGDGVPEEKKEELDKKLALMTSTMFSYIHNSNFDTQIAESYADLAVGVGALMILEGDDENPLNFVSIPINEIYIDKGAHGLVRNVYRRFNMPIRNIEETWPDAVIPSKMKEQMDKDTNEEVELIESTLWDSKTKNYIVSVDWVGEKMPLFSKIEKSSPWVVFRWSTTSGEVWGSGVLLNSLADIKTLNKTVEFLLKAASLKIIPTFVCPDDGTLNPHTIKIKSGGIIPVSNLTPDGRSPLQPLQVGGDVNLGQFIIKEMRSNINEMMHTDAIGDVNAPVKTATEVSIRQQELAKRIGSSFGKLQFELIAPLVNRVLYILNRRGLLPFSLEDLKVDGKVIKLKHISPLAQAQSEEDLMNTVRFAETLMGVFGQMGMTFINTEKFAEKVADHLSVDKDLMSTPEQREQMMQMAGQAQGLSEGA